MKRIIIFASLALFSAGPLMAQQAAPAKSATEQAAHDKRLFTTKIDELSANASRNAAEASKTSAEQLMTLIQQQTRVTYALMEKATDAGQKAALRKKYNSQVNIMASVKPKIADPIKNLQPLLNNFREFQKTL